jgi:hypothetical protein
MMSDETEVVARFRCQQETIHSLGSQFAMMAEHGSGEWVRYSDYRALEHQLVADRPPSPLPNAGEVLPTTLAEFCSLFPNDDHFLHWLTRFSREQDELVASRDTIARLTREVDNLRRENANAQ